MKLRLTYNRQSGGSSDIAVVCDASTTVGELASYLTKADPQARSMPARSRMTLLVSSPSSVQLDPLVAVADCGLCSGSTVSVVPAGGLARAVERPPAVLQVLEGVDKGKTFPLSVGINTVGRSRSSAVALNDGLVSRAHARISVGDVVEINDLGSANGIEVNGSQVDRQVLQTNDQVRLGDTVFSVRLQHLESLAGRVDSSAVAFIRSPRLLKVFEGEEFEAPNVPRRPEPQQFPYVMLMVPLFMAGIMYMTTQNLASLLFIFMMPLMIVGSYVQQIMGGKAQFKRALKLFREDVDTLLAEIKENHDLERASRLLEAPSVAECLDASRTLSSLLWTRRTDSPCFGDLRFGLGTTDSRSLIKLPGAADAARDIFAELSRRVTPYRVIGEVPIVARPPMHGGVGVAGPGEAGTSVARSLVVQMAALHSPAELTICGVMSAAAYRDWEWLKWLPHVDGAQSPVATGNLAASEPAANALVSEIEELLVRRVEDQSSPARDGEPNFVLPIVVLLVEGSAPVEFARLVALADAGWRYGIYVIWSASELAQLPAACRTYADVQMHGTGDVGYLHSGDSVTPVVVEGVSLPEAAAFARRLAPVEDLAARSEDSSDLPRAVSYLALVGDELASEPEFVIERWLENRSIVTGPWAPKVLARKPANLRGVIGQNTGGLHTLDLRVDGPHALVGGTTGSGKSELLQTWILGMAANNSPERLTFLLVDYKGGSAFAECNDLPHTVGLVTDLNENGVRRALTSLSAELRYREHLLNLYSAKDLVTLEKMNPEAAPPSLVIVVDEFAALVQEVPEFVDGVVNVAQRGRSLGLHLVLATQRPAGVIKGNLRANTNLRVALRVADEEDSQDVIGSKAAAFFDADLPGRAVSKTGPGKYVTFQTGYVGGHTGAEVITVDPFVVELSPSGGVWELPPSTEEVVAKDPGPTDIEKIVTTMRAAHAKAELPVPRKPWLPDLATNYALELLPTRRRDDQLVFGVMDDAENQAQPTVTFRPDVEGNMAVFGASGTGKSTVLRTLAVAAGFTVRGGPCHVYGLDFGTQGLAMLEVLPHVGSIVSMGDDERIERLVRWLRDVIDERAVRYSKVNASTITQYREISGDADEPRILLLVDGIGAAKAAYEISANHWILDALVSIASDGRPVGVHLIVSGDRVNALPSAMASAVQSRLVLRLANADDYSFVNVPKGLLSEDSPPGRGFFNGGEVQVAALGEDPDSAAQARAIRALAKSMERLPRRAAPQIRSCPEQVWLRELPVSVAGEPVIGMRSADLEPWGLPDCFGTFVVTGPPSSGKTQTVLSLVAALKRSDPAWEAYLITSRKRGLASEPGWTDVWSRPGTVGEACEFLTELLNRRGEAAPDASPKVVIVLEAANELFGGMDDSALERLISAVNTNDGFLIGEGEISAMSSGYGAITGLKAARRGISLQPDSSDGQMVFKTDFPPRLKRSSFPPGRGFLVGRGYVELGQIGLT